MPFAQALIYNFPPWLLGPIIVGTSLAFAIIGFYAFRFFVPQYKLKPHNDVAGFMFSTLGVIYAVLLAFMVIIVWENFDEADGNVQREASLLADLYRDVEAFQDPFKTEVVDALIAYGKSIVFDEWKTVQKAKKSHITQEKQNKLWSLYTKYEPVKEREKIFFQESVKKLNELCEFRRLRLLEAGEGIDPILWFVLIFCGVITVIFTFFFGMENLRNHIIMTCLLTSIISLILFTILEFDYPFTGELSVSPKAFTSLRMFENVK